MWSCWRAEASGRAGLRRAIVALEALLTRRRLKRAQGRWRLQVSLLVAMDGWMERRRRPVCAVLCCCSCGADGRRGWFVGVITR